MSISVLANRPILRQYDYQALDDGAFEFGWKKEDVYWFDIWWGEGFSLWKIADMLKRDVDEVAILLIDRARQGKIEKRSNGAFGWLSE